MFAASTFAVTVGGNEVPVWVAAISALSGILIALITVGLPILSEVRKGRSALGERGDEDPTLLELMSGIYHRLATNEERTARIETDIHEVKVKVNAIDRRVVSLEELRQSEAANNQGEQRT